MSSVDLSTYKQLYITTSFEQLHNIEEGIKVLVTDASSKEGLDQVYINAHTLVSKSMLMGYKQIGMVSHQIENLFFSVKQGQLHLSSEILSVLAQVTEGLRKGLESIKANDQETDMSSEIALLEKYKEKSL